MLLFVVIECCREDQGSRQFRYISLGTANVTIDIISIPTFSHVGVRGKINLKMIDMKKIRRCEEWLLSVWNINGQGRNLIN